MNTSRKPRILFVALQHSVHAAKWIESIAALGWDVHVFATYPWPAHPLMRNVTVHYPFRWLRWEWPKIPVRKGFSPPLSALLLWAINKITRYRGTSGVLNFPALQGPTALNRLIDDLKPNIIHSLEFQHCSYLVLESKRLYGGHFPLWGVSNWGSDISYFSHDPLHLPTIKDILQQADFYCAECERDMKLAQDLGWKDKPSLLALGFCGVDLAPWQEVRARIKTSHRRQIMVKGYQNLAGRALLALQAVEKCADQLRDYEVVLFLADYPDVRSYGKRLQTEKRLNIRILPPASHSAMMQELAKSRILVGVSVSDGVTATALEAMALGAFPIQSNTAAIDEWLKDGKGGFIIPPDNADVIADRLQQALTNDALVDNAAEINWRVAQEKLDWPVTSAKICTFYRAILKGMGEPP